MDYPGDVEIIIGTIRQDDPVVAMVGRLRADFPERNIQLVFAELQGTNRKTSIMEAMWQKATGQFLFFSDADVAAPENYLRQLVPQLAQPEVGCLTCLPRGIEARTIGGKMIALHYGFNYLPQWMLAQQTTGIHWAIGHTMAVPRAVLEKLGGFKNFLNHLADDYELGHRVSQLGLRVIVPPLLLDCVVPAESFGASVHPDAALETHHPPFARRAIFRRHHHLSGFLGADSGIAPTARLVVVERVGCGDADSLAARRRIAADCKNAGLAARLVAAAGRGCRGRNHFLRRVFWQHGFLGRSALHAASRWNLSKN